MIHSAEEALTLRDYRENDAGALSHLALAAFEEFQSAYSDWAAMSASISQMPSLDAAGERRLMSRHRQPICPRLVAFVQGARLPLARHHAPFAVGASAAAHPNLDVLVRN